MNLLSHKRYEYTTWITASICLIYSIFINYFNSFSRRDSTSEEITITSTLSSKLLTIKEASGTLERNSSLSVTTSSSSSTQNTSASVVTTAASSQSAAQQPRHESNTNSSINSATNGSHNVAPVSNSSSNNPHTNSSINSTTSSPQATPSINIVQSEQREQQPLQSQSVDSNGCATHIAASSCTDSPSSRKSSTSSKGKPAKLSTSSSGRDEVSWRN